MKYLDLTDIVIGTSIAIHRELGPGLLESVYEAVLFHELTKRGLRVRKQVPVPVTYCGTRIEVGFRMDLLVEERLILELKAVETLPSTAKTQLFTYLKFSGLKLGLILNFGGETMTRGIHRVVNGFDETEEFDDPPSLY